MLKIGKKRINRKEAEKSVSTDSSGRFELEYFEQVIEELKNHKHKLSTKKNYRKIWENFNKFIVKLNYIPKSWEQKLMIYCSFLVENCRLQSSTVRSYATAIKQTLLIDGHKWDNNLFIMSTFTQACKLEKDVVHTRLPIQKGLMETILFEIENELDQQPYLQILYKTIFIVAYYGLFRICELSETDSGHTVQLKNVHICTNKKRILVILHTSKTHGKGDKPQEVNIQIDHNREREGNFNAYDLLKEYLANRNKTQTDYPLFIFGDNTPVQDKNVRNMLKTILTKLGLRNKLYNTHSFRIGRATDLLKFGYSIEEIKRAGRWRSNAVFRYLRWI